MNYLKDIFIKGRYHLYIGFAVLIEAQRQYLLPQTNLYKNLRKAITQELKITQPDKDTTNLKIEDMTLDEINLLRSATKKKVEQVQIMSSDQLATMPLTITILSMGAINYFISPTTCAIFVTSYLTLQAADYAKSISVIKFGVDPLWRWKMKDMGYVLACCFGALTVGFVTRSGISKLKERVAHTRAIIMKENNDLSGKNQ